MTDTKRLGTTPSQTVGPFFSMRLGGSNVLAAENCPGERIRIEGTVLDGGGRIVEDALIEIWQANARGRYQHEADTRTEIELDPGFIGFGQAETDFETGGYWFETVRPGPVPDPEGELQAPHIAVIVQARGTMNPYFTRLYFPEEESSNSKDLIMQMVPPSRRSTLIAEKAGDGLYRFDIRLQGEGETVFLDF